MNIVYLNNAEFTSLINKLQFSNPEEVLPPDPKKDILTVDEIHEHCSKVLYGLEEVLLIDPTVCSGFMLYELTRSEEPVKQVCMQYTHTFISRKKLPDGPIFFTDNRGSIIKENAQEAVELGFFITADDYLKKFYKLPNFPPPLASKYPIDQKVYDIKNLFTSGGLPVIKTNHFTSMHDFWSKPASSNQYRHAQHLAANKKTWNDYEIRDQVTIVQEIKPISSEELENIFSIAFNKLTYQNIVEDQEKFESIVRNMMNYRGQFVEEFWFNFHQTFGTLNEELKEPLSWYKKYYGFKGTFEIFGSTSFNSLTSPHYKINNIHKFINVLKTFNNVWKEQKKLYDNRNTIFRSPYKDLQQIEEEVPFKKIKQVAKEFYLDKTKDFNQRIKVFNEHGEEKGFYHTPHNNSLRKIFEDYKEEGFMERHETIHCTTIIEWWIDELAEKRCIITPIRSRIEVEKEDRYYQPSETAIQRLKKRYIEILFIEEISNFKFDW